MKHGMKITFLLITFYIVAQIIGLTLLSMDLKVQTKDGQTSLEYDDTFLGERPEMTGPQTFLYIVIGVLVGTGLILLIIKFGKLSWWKFWFLLASFLAISLSLGVVANTTIALTIGAMLAILKIYKPNIIIHNLTEILMYSGIAIFIVPMLDLQWAIIMLLTFSAYDAYAVWHSKHMVKMAEFQADTNLFAGLTIPYKGFDKIKLKQKKMKIKKKNKHGVKTAILGGGDVAFPLLFTGAVMNWLLISGLSKPVALLQSLIITVFSAISLYLLFYYAEKEKFYPAMPFITTGCLLGLLIIYLI